jgi:muramidase (phage lysozyme)
MMDAYDRMRYGDNFDKAREAMSKAKGNPFDSTNNPAKFLVNEEGQKKAVKQGIEMNKHFFAPGGGREREINNPSTATPSAAPSLSDISTSNKGDGRSAFATSSQRAKDDAAKAGTLKPVTDAVNKVKSWLTGNSGGSGWGALGATIKFAEGTHRMGEKSYNTGFGYNMIDDLSKHPDTVWDGSAAAGAYQFMPNTWNEAKSALKLTDFGPQSQEKAGEFLTNRRGVQTDKQFKTVQEFREALDKLAPEWASIPLSSTGKSYYDGDGRNNARRFDELLKFYEKQVGYKLN